MAKKFPCRASGVTSCGSPAGAKWSQVEGVADFDISAEPVRRWVRQADVDDGVVDGRTTAAQSELQLRRENRQLEMENEILRRTQSALREGVGQ